LASTQAVTRAEDGPAVYTYDRVPGVPPVTVMRLDERSMDGLEAGHSHTHDFLLLAYFERDGGSLWLGGRRWHVNAGDVYVVAPGEVIAVGDNPRALANARGWGVFFPPEGLGPEAPDALLSWRSHPLLLPFVRGVAEGAQRLSVPPSDRRAWSDRLSALSRELEQRRDGYATAVPAHLTLLLVELTRMAADIVRDLRLKDEPLLANVFRVIEDRYSDPISLKDVAAELGLTPAYLTTVVRRKTGRTVQEWIGERRMAQARRLLVETDKAVAEVGRCVGYADPAYFVRSFRTSHGTTPLRWRRAGRP
jgi:AraC family transcriptional regulator, transcriptional activator of pobA